MPQSPHPYTRCGCPARSVIKHICLDGQLHCTRGFAGCPLCCWPCRLHYDCMMKRVLLHSLCKHWLLLYPRGLSGGCCCWVQGAWSSDLPRGCQPNIQSLAMVKAIFNNWHVMLPLNDAHTLRLAATAIIMQSTTCSPRSRTIPALQQPRWCSNSVCTAYWGLADSASAACGSRAPCCDD